VGSSGAISAQPRTFNETIPVLGSKPYTPQKPAERDRADQGRSIDDRAGLPQPPNDRRPGKRIFTLSRLVEGSSAEGSAPILWRGHAATGADR
jgi:hypothetical protein